MIRKRVYLRWSGNLSFIFIGMLMSGGCTHVSSQDSIINTNQLEIQNKRYHENSALSTEDKSVSLSPGDVVGLIFLKSYDNTEPYRLSSDDKIYVNVYGHPEYSKEVSVLPDGTISIPKAGVVNADGLSIKQLERNITEVLEKDMREPQVNVVVLDAQSKLNNFLDTIATSTAEGIFRTEVDRSGMLDLPAVGAVPVTGLNIKETEKRIIEHYNKVFPNLTVHLKLLDSQQFKVVVVGEVAKPGVYPLTGRVDPLQALALAGGAQVTAGLNEVYLLRTNKTGKVEKIVINLDGEETMEKNRVANIYVQGGDLVFVPMSGIANADRIVDQYVRRIIPGNLGAGAYWNFNQSQTSNTNVQNITTTNTVVK